MGLVATVVWIVLATLGVQWLGWGLLAIAGAESIAKSVKCILMWTWIRPHLGHVQTGKLAVFCAKVALISVLAAVAAGFVGTRLAAKVVQASGRPSATIEGETKPGTLFARDDLQSTSDMLSKLRDNEDDALSRYLFGRTSPNFQQQLKATKAFEEPLKQSLIDELNTLVQGPNLYDEKLFEETKLKEETRALLKQAPQGRDLITLNRALLEDAYPQELVKRPHKMKMLLVVTVAGILGMLVAVAFAALLRIEEATQLGKFGAKIKNKLAR
jgi:hypothetical protein